MWEEIATAVEQLESSQLAELEPLPAFVRYLKRLHRESIQTVLLTIGNPDASLFVATVPTSVETHGSVTSSTGFFAACDASMFTEYRHAA